MTDTRERMMETATTAFAERGFHGTSLAAIAAPLPFTKQALLHHFGSKEKLYGEVLRRISDGLMAVLEGADDQTEAPRIQLEHILLALYRHSAAQRTETRLLMRELLDNQRRAETAKTWYLKPFLEAITDRVQAASANKLERETALVVAYQLLGAMTYFVVSTPTLTAMFGEAMVDELGARFEAQLRKLLTARLELPGG
ncbi:MAG: TetR/AcrR family transcriptional regulator [Pseudomonadota bacterium]